MIAPKSWLNQFVSLKGISDSHFAAEMTFAGNKVESTRKLTGETIYEFEITSNRPDTLSIIGLAREASAIFDRKLSLPKSIAHPSKTHKPVSLKISSPKLCPAYSLVEISWVNVKPASKSITNRLKQVGVNPVNNIVDITNYLMIQTGQPMHAFDADTIKGSLTLRAAKKDEKIIPLDHKERVLSGGEIIIQDQEKLVDLAGLMGGLNSEVTQNTRKVLLLVPVYDPISIRRASKFLGLRTEASTRFEKKIDLTQTAQVTNLALQMIKKQSGGKPSSAIITKKSTWKPIPIQLKPQIISAQTGREFTQKQVDSTLQKLSFTQTSQGFTPPPFRRDVNQTVDLIEEVVRLTGYNRLPRTLPTGTIPTHPDALVPNWPRLLQQLAASLGYTETYSSTLIGSKLITSLNLNPHSHLKVLHPMSRDFEYMRLTTLESLIPAVINNLTHTPKINLFELGTVFLPNSSPKKLPHQPLELGLVSTTITYPQLKGHLDKISSSFNLQLSILSTQNPTPPYMHPTKLAIIAQAGKTVGIIGQLSPQIFPPQSPQVLALSLNLTQIISLASSAHIYSSPPSKPPIIEDLTFTLKPKTYIGEVIDEIYATSKLVETVNLKVTYQSNYTFTLTYRDPHKSLTDKLIAPIRKKIVSNLSKSFSAKLKGKL